MDSAEKSNHFNDVLKILEADKQRVETLQKMMQEYKDLKDKLKKNLKDIMVETEIKKQKLREEDNNHFKTKNRLERLQNKLKMLKEHVQNDSKMLEVKEKIMAKLNEQMEKVQSIQEDTKNMLDIYNAELSRVHNKFLETEKKFAENRIDEVKKASEEIENLKKEAHDHQKIEQRERLRKTKLVKETELKQIVSDNEKLLSEIETRGVELKKAQALKKKIYAEKEQEADKIMDEIVKKYRNENTDLSHNIQLAKKTIEDGLDDNANQQLMLQTQVEKTKELEEDLQGLRNATENLIAEQNAKKHELNSKINDLSSDNKDLEISARQKKSAILELELKNKDLQKEGPLLLEKQIELKKQYQIVEEELKAKNDLYSLECNTLKKTLDALTNEVNDFKTEIENIDRQIEMETEAFLKDHEKRQHSLNGALKELQQLIAEKSVIVNDLKKGFDQVNCRISEMEEEKENMNEYLRGIKEQININKGILEEKIEKEYKAETELDKNKKNNLASKEFKDRIEKQVILAAQYEKKIEDCNDKKENAKLTTLSAQKINNSLKKEIEQKIEPIAEKKQHIINLNSQMAKATRVSEEMCQLEHEMNNMEIEKEKLMKHQQEIKKLINYHEKLKNEVQNVQLKLQKCKKETTATVQTTNANRQSRIIKKLLPVKSEPTKKLTSNADLYDFDDSDIEIIEEKISARKLPLKVADTKKLM